MHSPGRPVFGRRTSPPGEEGASSDVTRPQARPEAVERAAAGSEGQNAVEQRASPRALSLKPGRIIMDGAPNGVDCTVRDLSLGGAGIHLAGRADLPAAMQLLIVSDGLLFDCALVWRQDDRVGLRFTSRRDLRSDADGFQVIRTLWRQLAARQT